MAPIVGLGLELLEQVPLDYDAPAGEPSLGKLHQRRLGAALPKERIWQLQVGHCPPAPGVRAGEGEYVVVVALAQQPGVVVCVEAAVYDEYHAREGHLAQQVAHRQPVGGSPLVEARAYGRARLGVHYYSFMDDLKSVQLLILDDFLTTPIATQNAVDLFEILEGCNEKVATLIASQLEPHEWYLWIEGESMADSILGRVASAARRYDLDGPDMQRYFAKGMPEL